MAFSDNPFFPNEESASEYMVLAEPVEIDEGCTYFAKFYKGDPPRFFKNAVFCQRGFQDGIFELNFRNFVGLTRIGRLKLHIQNRKISNRLYEAMLNDLAEQYAGLVFSFGSPVGQHYSKSGVGKDSAFIEYLFLQKYLLNQNPDIDAIANIFLHDPHRQFEKKLQHCFIQECHTADTAIIHAIINSPMAPLRQYHPLLSTTLGAILKQKTGKNLYPVEAAREIKFQTVDTNENRFIKFFLQDLLKKLESIKNAISQTDGSYFNPDIHSNLNLLRQKIGHFLTHNMWQEVGPMKFIPVNSQILQRRDGYRRLFSLYSLLQLATHCDFIESDFTNLIEIKDVPTLYEYWCFFQVKLVVDSLVRISRVDRIVTDTPVEHKLSEGLCVEYKGGAMLFFNKTYGGSEGFNHTQERESSHYQHNTSYSHPFRPDIVITKNDKKLIFDAKYKGKRSGFYCENDDGTIQSWKPEDIDKMHTYREAIRGVVGSFILFPGRKTTVFPAHESNNFFEGVGALSLRPDSNGAADSSNIDDIKSLVSAFFANA